MSFKSSSDHYGAVAVSIHWLSAILIIALLAIGYQLDEIKEAAAKAEMLRLHVPLGIAVLLLTLFRIIWWWLADNKPAPVAMPTWQERLARVVHFLFYVTILGTTLSGVAMMILSGALPVIFSDPVEALPDFWDYPPRAPHGIAANAVAALLILHAGAALYHHFFQRDGLLRRMWYSKRL